MMNDRDIIALSRRFRALSNPHRLHMVLVLLQRQVEATDSSDGVPLCEVAEALLISPSTLSHHIDILVSCGLVSATRVGRKLSLKANLAALEEIELLEMRRCDFLAKS